MEFAFSQDELIALGGGVGAILLAIVLFIRIRRKGREQAAPAPKAKAAADSPTGRQAAPVSPLQPAVDRSGGRQIQRGPAAWLDGVGRSYEVAANGTLIGRGSGQGIDLDDPAISTEHAIIRYEDGVWMLYDLASANGTFLDEERILAPAQLSEGARIQAGATVLRFRTRANAAAPRGARAPVRPASQGGAAAGGTQVLPQGPVAAADEHQADETTVLPQEVAWLLVTEGPHAGLSAGVAPGALMVGRQPTAGGMQLPDDDAASREHLLIRATGTGMTLRDLGSTNGTMLNGSRISGEVALQVGDTIRLGATTIKVVRERI